MSDIKLVLTDFDGTIAEFGKHEVSNKVRQAVIACEEKGVRMVPVTGRFYEMAQPVLEILGFEDLGVFDNGATIQNAKTGELVWSKWMQPDQLQLVARALLPFTKLFDYTPEHEIHEPAANEAERISQITEPASHVYVLVRQEDLPQVRDVLSVIPGITFYMAASTREEWPDYIGIQINHAQADKFHGAEALRDILDIPKEYTLAIGDGDNDVALFKNAGLKIAMGNATDLLKAQADHIVAPVQEDGFAEAMQRFVLS